MNCSVGALTHVGANLVLIFEVFMLENILLLDTGEELSLIFWHLKCVGQWVSHLLQLI